MFGFLQVTKGFYWPEEKKERKEKAKPFSKIIFYSSLSYIFNNTENATF